MALTEISMDDTCNALKDVLLEKSEQYDLSMDEALDVLMAFCNGMASQMLYIIDPEKYKEFEKYMINVDDLKIDIPDNISELLDGE